MPPALPEKQRSIFEFHLGLGNKMLFSIEALAMDPWLRNGTKKQGITRFFPQEKMAMQW